MSSSAVTPRRWDASSTGLPPRDPPRFCSTVLVFIVSKLAERVPLYGKRDVSGVGALKLEHIILVMCSCSRGVCFSEHLFGFPEYWVSAPNG